MFGPLNKYLKSKDIRKTIFFKQKKFFRFMNK